MNKVDSGWPLVSGHAQSRRTILTSFTIRSDRSLCRAIRYSLLSPLHCFRCHCWLPNSPARDSGAVRTPVPPNLPCLAFPGPASTPHRPALTPSFPRDTRFEKQTAYSVLSSAFYPSSAVASASLSSSSSSYHQSSSSSVWEEIFRGTTTNSLRRLQQLPPDR